MHTAKRKTVLFMSADKLIGAANGLTAKQKAEQNPFTAKLRTQLPETRIIRQFEEMFAIIHTI